MMVLSKADAGSASPTRQSRSPIWGLVKHAVPEVSPLRGSTGSDCTFNDNGRFNDTGELPRMACTTASVERAHQPTPRDRNLKNAHNN